MQLILKNHSDFHKRAIFLNAMFCCFSVKPYSFHEYLYEKYWDFEDLKTNLEELKQLFILQSFGKDKDGHLIDVKRTLEAVSQAADTSSSVQMEETMNSLNKRVKYNPS